MVLTLKTYNWHLEVTAWGRGDGVFDEVPLKSPLLLQIRSSFACLYLPEMAFKAAVSNLRALKENAINYNT